jgi:antibiotic biosynthesis monooxygenase (ABM) superfamily enzyme
MPGNALNSPAVLIATAKIRPGCEDAFAAWKGRHDAALAAFAGFRSSDIIPPGDHDGAWTILLNFDSWEHLTAWQRSDRRAAIMAELTPLAIGGNLGEVMQAESPDAVQPGVTVTQVIFSQLRPGMEDDYRAWAARMQEATARYPGYQGTYLQPPGPGGTHWITMLRFGSAEQLNTWLAAPERAAMLEEARDFIEREELTRLATSFPGWVRLDPKTGAGPPNWKTALLVLLGLYPIVALELLYLNPLLRGVTPALGIFIGNVLSVSATSFLTMPYLVTAFDGWLFAEKTAGSRRNALGLALIAAIFAGEIGLVACLFRWGAG